MKTVYEFTIFPPSTGVIALAKALVPIEQKPLREIVDLLKGSAYSYVTPNAQEAVRVLDLLRAAKADYFAWQRRDRSNTNLNCIPREELLTA